MRLKVVFKTINSFFLLHNPSTIGLMDRRHCVMRNHFKETSMDSQNYAQNPRQEALQVLKGNPSEKKINYLAIIEEANSETLIKGSETLYELMTGNVRDLHRELANKINARKKDSKMNTFNSEFTAKERLRKFFNIDNFYNTDDLNFVDAHAHYAVEYLATMEEEKFIKLLLKLENSKTTIEAGKALIKYSEENLILLKENNCLEEACRELTKLKKLRDEVRKIERILEWMKIASNLKYKLSKTNFIHGKIESQ